ncbi:phage holin family protein [Roseibacterium sp. SDUM158016]|uniref:phage holin family protein n=1 Tax=Roseicyclus sediminis TaxID=2980997 RepID=UPI0021D2FB01|nr:phage holin family protein [Roseibacterium sp. SDUM158016]MCU4652721.1 phage holin family protein [Roseibacterium sp. SDUM158016]
MLEDLIGAFVRSQFGDVRRRTTGAMLELAAFGMIGLAILFVFVAMYLWLSARLDMWLAALIVAAVALAVAAVLLLVGRSLLRRKARRRQDDALSSLQALGLLSRQPDASDEKDRTEEPGAIIVGAALAAGVLLGRSFGR